MTGERPEESGRGAMEAAAAMAIENARSPYQVRRVREFLTGSLVPTPLIG